MKRLFVNTVFSSLEMFVLVALNILATPIYIHYFGLANYGVFIFLSTFSTYGLLSFFDLGMSGALLNYVARFEAEGNREKIQDCLTITLIFYGVIGMILGIALYLGGGVIIDTFHDDTGTLDRAVAVQAAHLVAINVVVQFLTLPFVGVLQGLRRYVVTKSVNTVLMVAQYGLVIWIAAYTGRIDAAMGMVLVITLVRLAVLTLIVWLRIEHFRPFGIRIRIELVKTLFGYTSVLLVSRIVGLVFNQMDKVLIWLFLQAAQVGLYDVIVRPGNLIRILLTTVNSSIVPEVARLHQQNRNDRIGRLYVDLVRYAYLLILPVLAVLYIHIEALLDLWVGPELAQYYPLSLIILSVYFVAPVAAVASTMAIGLEIVKNVIWISIAASVINVCLSLLLLGKLGLAGLLTATLVAEVFMVGPYFRSMSRTVGVTLGALVRPLITVFVVALLFLGANFLLGKVVVGAAVLVPACALLAAAHCAVNYRFLLYPNERAYLMDKVRSGLRTR